MKIKVSNLGAIAQAEFELGELTIICGGNNTGKTYATYALFGFLDFWNEVFYIDIPLENVQTLLTEGSVELEIQDYLDKLDSIFEQASRGFSEQLVHVFASSEKYFIDSLFAIKINKEEVNIVEEFERTMGSARNQLFSITKKATSNTISISLLVDKDNISIARDAVARAIGSSLKEILFGNLLHKPFIASAERTGAAIFRKELNFARNRMFEQMGSSDNEINPFELLSQVYSDYALPVKSNVDFTRQLEELSKRSSFIEKDFPHILDDFIDIIGGEYHVTNSDELYYIPKKGRVNGRKLKLTMDESSSAVRSLLDIGFYLRHVAQKGDLLMVDEPELNLHPENQRRVARLFAQLINVGIKVFITTHSDYIIKELNTLIMFNQGGERLTKLAEQEGYHPHEFLDANKVRLYIAEEALIMPDGATRRKRCQTLVPAKIDEQYGIEARSFDTTIETMNRIQEEIVWGE